MFPRAPESKPSSNQLPDLVPGTRDRLLNAAHDLFYRRGIRNVGIDEVIAAAGVAKASLYKHFPSKDELVAECLRRRDASWRVWLVEQVNARASSPNAKLLAVFDVVGLWLADADFRGCAFQNATVEVADAKHPAHLAAASHKQGMRAYLGELAHSAGVRNPDALADQLAMLLEGALISALLNGAPATTATARAAALFLLRAAADE
ncbi:MAG: TetR/AcrR family transcriptional regulator [Phycisphaerae bacterium]|nr:TetR/AcrR family transcriptional regulator [Gemmatimonadaceae bacterium]